MTDWSQFDNMVTDEVMSKVEGLDAGKKEYEKVPYDKYEVVPERIELKSSNNGNPMTVVWFRIVAGPKKGAIIFANTVISTKNPSFGIHKSKVLIKSLKPSCAVDFNSFTQWDILIKGVAEEVCGKSSYVMNYGEDVTKSGSFDKYEILDGPFEVPMDYKPPTYEKAAVQGDWVQM